MGRCTHTSAKNGWSSPLFGTCDLLFGDITETPSLFDFNFLKSFYCSSQIFYHSESSLPQLSLSCHTPTPTQYHYYFVTKIAPIFILTSTTQVWNILAKQSFARKITNSNRELGSECQDFGIQIVETNPLSRMKSYKKEQICEKLPNFGPLLRFRRVFLVKSAGPTPNLPLKWGKLGLC